MSRRNYVVEFDHTPDLDEVKRIRRQIRAALTRGQILATDPTIHIRDLGPARPTIRLAMTERWLTA